jgi:hypothetical protein
VGLGVDLFFFFFLVGLGYLVLLIGLSWGYYRVAVLMGPGQIRGVMGWVSELFSNWGPKYPG